MRRVSLFVPCLVDLFLPEIGEAAVALLRRLGVEVVYHEAQTCCGQPAVNAGYLPQARKVARHFLTVFGEDETIVCPAGSCVVTVKRHYPELFADEPGWLARAEALAPRVYELSEYLVDVLGVEDIGASFDGKVAYHEACHVLRGLGVSEQPKKLIRAAAGAEFVPLNAADACCGFGGEFSFHYPDISEVMVAEKAANFINSGADALVLCEPGCLLNISGYLHRHHPDRKVFHLATFLAGNGKGVRV